VRSRPGAARTILLFQTISARPSKQPRMVGSTLGVYSLGLIFVSARTNKRHHHHQHIESVRRNLPKNCISGEFGVENGGAGLGARRAVADRPLTPPFGTLLSNSVS
jgi:hypothetical protein